MNYKKYLIIALGIFSVALFCESRNIINYYGNNYVEGYEVSYTESTDSSNPMGSSDTDYHTKKDIDGIIIWILEWAIVAISIYCFWVALGLFSTDWYKS